MDPEQRRTYAASRAIFVGVWRLSWDDMLARGHTPGAGGKTVISAQNFRQVSEGRSLNLTGARLRFVVAFRDFCCRCIFFETVVLHLSVELDAAEWPFVKSSFLKPVPGLWYNKNGWHTTRRKISTLLTWATGASQNSIQSSSESEAWTKSCECVRRQNGSGQRRTTFATGVGLDLDRTVINFGELFSFFVFFWWSCWVWHNITTERKKERKNICCIIWALGQGDALICLVRQNISWLDIRTLVKINKKRCKWLRSNVKNASITVMNRSLNLLSCGQSDCGRFLHVFVFSDSWL